MWPVAALLFCLLATSEAQEKKRPQPKAAKADTLTGCLDQRNGEFILAEPKTLEKLALLEPAEYKRESFPKHVGHRVTVTGQLTGSGEAKVMRVRSVKTIADMCAPDP